MTTLPELYFRIRENGAAVYRIDIEAWSGKKKEVAPDFPGAYRYEDHQPDAA